MTDIRSRQLLHQQLPQDPDSRFPHLLKGTVRNQIFDQDQLDFLFTRSFDDEDREQSKSEEASRRSRAKGRKRA